MSIPVFQYSQGSWETRLPLRVNDDEVFLTQVAVWTLQCWLYCLAAGRAFCLLSYFAVSLGRSWLLRDMASLR